MYPYSALCPKIGLIEESQRSRSSSRRRIYSRQTNSSRLTRRHYLTSHLFELALSRDTTAPPYTSLQTRCSPAISGSSATPVRASRTHYARFSATASGESITESGWTTSRASSYSSTSMASMLTTESWLIRKACLSSTREQRATRFLSRRISILTWTYGQSLHAQLKRLRSPFSHAASIPRSASGGKIIPVHTSRRCLRIFLPDTSEMPPRSANKGQISRGWQLSRFHQPHIERRSKTPPLRLTA